MHCSTCYSFFIKMSTLSTVISLVLILALIFYVFKNFDFLSELSKTYSKKFLTTIRNSGSSGGGIGNMFANNGGGLGSKIGGGLGSKFGGSRKFGPGGKVGRIA